MKSALMFMGILFYFYLFGKIETYYFGSYYFLGVMLMFLGLLKIWDMADYINKHID